MKGKLHWAALALDASVTPPAGDAPPPPAGDPPSGDPPPTPPPVEYNLTLPEGSAQDPAVVERTTAIVRELGLSPDHAQKVLGLVTQEAASHASAAVEENMKSYLPGGAGWVRLHEEAEVETLKAYGGDPAKMADGKRKATVVAARFGTPEALDRLATTGSMTLTDMVLILDRLHGQFSEDKLITAGDNPPPQRKSHAEVLYPTKKKDGEQ